MENRTIQTAASLNCINDKQHTNSISISKPCKYFLGYWMLESKIIHIKFSSFIIKARKRNKLKKKVLFFPLSFQKLRIRGDEGDVRDLSGVWNVKDGVLPYFVKLISSSSRKESLSGKIERLWSVFGVHALLVWYNLKDVSE